MHMMSTPGLTKILRRSEIQNFDHTNIQEYIIGYNITGIDESVLTLPTTSAQVDTLITNNNPQIENDVIRSGAIPEAVELATESGYILTDEQGYELIIQQ